MPKAAKDAVAAALYIILGIYLFYPYFGSFTSLQYLMPLNCFIGSFGAYWLSRRWIAGFAGNILAGAVYGFGPYILSLIKFHPSAGFLAAMIPWLFLPAAFCTKAKSQWRQIPLSLIPFAAIILFFQAAAKLGLFPLPLQIPLSQAELVSLLSPAAVAQKSNILLGFYHIPLGSLLIGLSMLFAARRYGIIIIITAGIILAFLGSFLQVSLVIWFAIPLACLSVAVGQGTEGIINAGYSDRKWVLAGAIVLMVLSAASLLLATKYAYVIAGLGLKYTAVFTDSAKMYILAAVSMFIIFLLSQFKIRFLWFRVAVVGITFALDLILTAKYIIDSTI